MAAPKSIFERKLDFAYLVMFSLQTLIIVGIDIVPFYPSALQHQSVLDLRQHHIDTYHDRFFTEPPAWFMLYTWLEAVYNLPFCLWVIPALIRDSPYVPLQLLIFSVQTVVCTTTCIVDFWSWENFTSDEKWNLFTLYGPYSIIPAFMMIDTILRLNKIIAVAQQAKVKSS